MVLGIQNKQVESNWVIQLQPIGNKAKDKSPKGFVKKFDEQTIGAMSTNFLSEKNGELVPNVKRK